jgi:hypothetical protein
MTRIPFRDWPWLIKLTVGLTFFNSWVLFEETVIDRHGLWQYLPLYVVGQFCAWDALALAIIAAVLWRLTRARGSPRERI